MKEEAGPESPARVKLLTIVNKSVKKQKDDKPVTITQPIGRLRNFEMWKGTARWVLDGAFLVGPKFYKPLIFLLIVLVINGFSIFHLSVSHR